MRSRRANTEPSARARLAPRLRACLLLPCALLPSLLARPALAHQGHRSYCAVRTVPGGLEMTVEVPLQQLVENPDGSRDKTDDASILSNGARYRHQLEAHVRAVTPAGACELRSAGPRLTGDSERRAVFDLDVTCPAGPITLASDYHLDLNAQAEMVCAIDGGAHVFRRGALERLVGTPPSLASSWFDFVKLGAEHVLAGIDHVLFVLSLLLGAASAIARDPRGTLRRLVGLVTGFTLGHSVTLIAAGLGVLSLPSRFTESMIALSIVVVSVHNVLDENPRGRTVTSASFGLIHGFGFASVLADIGLPRRGTVSALLAFNVGIELAQLGLVLVCFPALAWARRRAWFRSALLIPACGVIAGLGTLWFLKRAFDLSMLPWLGG